MKFLTSLSLSLAAPWLIEDAGADVLAIPTQEELATAMRSIAADHPERITILPVGTSREGRPIEALRITGASPAPAQPFAARTIRSQ